MPAAVDWLITPDFDDDPGWVPGVVTQPSSDQTSRTTDVGIPPPDTSSQADPEIAAVQNVGPAGLDWRITPDFDDDPGWQPGIIFPPLPSADDGGLRPAALSQHDAGIEQVPDAGSFATGSADEPPLRDETQTTSLTLAELNEQYPGTRTVSIQTHLDSPDVASFQGLAASLQHARSDRFGEHGQARLLCALCKKSCFDPLNRIWRSKNGPGEIARRLLHWTQAFAAGLSV